MQTQQQVCLSVCTRCRPPGFAGVDEERPGYRLAQSILGTLEQDPDNHRWLSMRGVRCMSQCKRPCVVALSSPSKFTLLFGDLSWQTDAAPVLSLARQYAASSDGHIPRPERPAPLRAGILGKIPPLHHAGDVIDTHFTFTPVHNTHEVNP